MHRKYSREDRKPKEEKKLTHLVPAVFLIVDVLVPAIFLPFWPHFGPTLESHRESKNIHIWVNFIPYIDYEVYSHLPKNWAFILYSFLVRSPTVKRVYPQNVPWELVFKLEPFEKKKMYEAVLTVCSQLQLHAAHRWKPEVVFSYSWKFWVWILATFVTGCDTVRRRTLTSLHS